jgi:integrase
MKKLFRLYRRCNGIYYTENSLTRKQQSLRTREEEVARILLNAKNEAARQPMLNRLIGLTYLNASTPEAIGRTWKVVMDEIAFTKQGSTRHRYNIAWKDPAFELIGKMSLLETKAEHFLKVLRIGTVSTNNYLRRLHNFALAMNWLAEPVVPSRQWPKMDHKEKRAITQSEHEAIVANEKNPERRAYYQLVWHTGAAQTDLATLTAEDVDWEQKTIGFFRRKTGSVVLFRFGETVAAILQNLPRQGPLFPKFSTLAPGDRSNIFRRRCESLNITGVTLHSYRYAWAERAKMAGYPERYAQEALGHKSQAVHRSYAKRAKMLLPPLEDFEKNADGLTAPVGG